jgi:hypothetical protein
MTRNGVWANAWLAVVGVPTVCVVLATSSATAHASKTNDAGPAPVAALWHAPTDLADRDLFSGAWGADRAPDPRATYTFVRPKRGGVNPGMVVRDGRGRIWHVKQAPRNHQGEEGPVEVVLSRVLSAVGYRQPPVYYLPSFTLSDESGTHVVPGGRFRLEEPSMKSQGSWAWRRNPFVGTQPYKGLLVILLVFNSWDLKDSNNTMYDIDEGGTVTRWYAVRDLGAALGETGRLAPKRNNIEEFERETFISKVNGSFVEFKYSGWQPGLLRHTITIDDVQWAMRLLGGLSDRQWRDAFRAGGYPDDLSDRFIRKLKANISAGQQLAALDTPSPDERR